CRFVVLGGVGRGGNEELRGLPDDGLAGERVEGVEGHVTWSTGCGALIRHGRVSAANNARWSVSSTVYADTSRTPIRRLASTWSIVVFGSVRPSYGQVGVKPASTTEAASRYPEPSRSRSGPWSRVAVKSPSGSRTGPAAWPAAPRPGRAASPRPGTGPTAHTG